MPLKSAEAPPGSPSNSDWAYTNSQDSGSPQPLKSSTKAVSWTASEFIIHEKNTSWYFALAAITAAVAGGVFVLNHHDYASVALIIVAAIIFGVFAARSPRVLSYAIDNQGISIDNKLYSYTLFRSYSLLQEGAVHSIVLLPMKRFMPPLTIYFAPEDEEKIITVLGPHLANNQRGHDLIDKLMRKIRF